MSAILIELSIRSDHEYIDWGYFEGLVLKEGKDKMYVEYFFDAENISQEDLDLFDEQDIDSRASNTNIINILTDKPFTKVEWCIMDKNVDNKVFPLPTLLKLLLCK